MIKLRVSVRVIISMLFEQLGNYRIWRAFNISATTWRLRSSNVMSKGKESMDTYMNYSMILEIYFCWNTLMRVTWKVHTIHCTSGISTSNMTPPPPPPPPHTHTHIYIHTYIHTYTHTTDRPTFIDGCPCYAWKGIVKVIWRVYCWNIFTKRACFNENVFLWSRLLSLSC